MIGNTAPDALKFMRDTGILSGSDAGSRVYYNQAPQSATFPYVVLNIISRSESPTQAEGSAVDTYRVQVDVFAKSGNNDSAFQIAHDVSHTLRSTWSRAQSTVGLYDNAIDSIQEVDHQTDYIPDMNIYHIINDYMVRVTGEGTTTTTDGVIQIKANKIYVKKITLTYQDFQTASTTNTIQLWTFPAKGLMHMITGQTSTKFSGGLISAYSLKVGITGELDKFLPDTSVFTTSTLPYGAMLSSNIESMAATTSLKVTATSVGANLSAATAGVIDYWIYYSILI